MAWVCNWRSALRSKTVLDSGFPRRGFRIPGILDSNFCQWNLDSGFQSLVGFRIPWAVFRGTIHSTKIPTGPTGNGSVFSRLFRLDRTDPLSFGPKFSAILFKWIAPPDSSCKMFRDPGFHEQQFHGFRNPVIPVIGTRSCVNKRYAIPKYSNEN